MMTVVPVLLRMQSRNGTWRATRAGTGLSPAMSPRCLPCVQFPLTSLDFPFPPARLSALPTPLAWSLPRVSSELTDAGCFLRLN